MKLKIWGLLLLLTGTALAAEGIYLPNTKKFATGTATGASQGLDVNIVGGSLVFSESAISSIGDPISSIQVKMAGGIDGSGNAQALLVDNTGKLQVVISSSALPSGASTSAKQDSEITLLTAISGKLPGTLGQKTMANSFACTLASDQSSIPVTGTFWQATQPVSGTFWQATQPISAAALPLPSGASTSSLQGTGNTSLASIDGKITAVNTGAVVISSSALPSGAATSGNQTTAQTSLSSIVTNTTKTPINLTGSGSSAGATVSTVATLSAPSNAIGFILMNLDTSSANIRWAVGRTASTTLGQQLQPGRDTGFVPIGASVSVIAESGTQNIDIQWIAQ